MLEKNNKTKKNIVNKHCEQGVSLNPLTTENALKGALEVDFKLKSRIKPKSENKPKQKQ